ncbi:uncharacterized protein, partial [Macaca fascicularis]|uniref:uncharacterized protein n=1 Tax=Macaca fascicularis TaxID=9541 RepID=UPI003D158271
LQRKRGGGDRGSRAQRLLAQPQEESCRHQEAVRAAGLGADNSRIYRACREPPRPARQPPTTTPARAPTPAAPPVRLGPARQGPLTLGPGGGAGGAAFPSRARAGRVSIACCAPGLAAALGLLALDADDSRAPKGSLRKFLEHLSGAGKAIGVLTSGGHAQDVHTEAVQAALTKHKEWKMAVPMPSKRRSLVVQTSMDAYTPPDTSSGSEDEGSLQGDSQGTPTSSQGSINMEHWISQAIHGSTTSTTSWSSTQSGDSRAANRLADIMAQTHMDNHSAPPDVTTYTSEHSIQMERPQGSTGSRTAPKYCNAELMETGNSTSQSRDVFFSGKLFVLMSRSVPVTGCVSSWGTICCHFIC